MVNATNVNYSQNRVSYESKLSVLKYPAALLMGLSTALSGGIMAIPRLYSHYKHQALHGGLEKAQVASLTEALKIVLSGMDRGKRSVQPIKPSLLTLQQDLLSKGGATAQEAGDLAEGALLVRGKIEALQRGEAVAGGVEGIKGDLARLMNLSVYRRFKDADVLAVNFLQIVALKLVAVDSNETLSSFGKACLGPIGNRGTDPKELGQLMWDYLQTPSFAIDRLYRIPYMLAHPFRTLHSVSSILDPLNFDASVGNPNHSAHPFEFGDKKMIFYYGPGPTGNPVFEHGVLPAYRKFGAFELRFNHQSTFRRDESVRVQEAVRIANENTDVLKHVVVGFDPAKDLSQFDSVDSFFDSYCPFMKKDLREISESLSHNGFYCPHELFSETQVDAALQMARELCKTLSAQNPFWEKAMESGASGKKQMGEVMKLVADTCFSLGILYQTFGSITPEMVARGESDSFDRDLAQVRVSGACKHDMDRGVLENASLRLFSRWAADSTPLCQREVYEIAGAVLGRARLIEDRNIMKSRYRILKDFLSFIGSAPQGVEITHQILFKYRNTFNKNN